MSVPLDMAQRDGGDSQIATSEAIGTRDRLPGYARVRRRRTRIRKFVRGATGVAELFGGGVDEEDDAIAVDQQGGDGMRLDQFVMVERRDARRERAHAAALVRCGP